MKIQKKSSDFRGIGRCKKRLEFEEKLGLESLKNTWYDNALICKEILNGYFSGKYQVSEFADLVSEGVEDNYETEETGRKRKEQLVSILKRAVLSESRIPETHHKKLALNLLNYEISVRPDAVFRTDQTIELVIYRAGKPSVTMKGKKRDKCVEQCLELYFLLLYGRTLLAAGETKTIRASYYFLRKDTDSKTGIHDNDFFSKGGGNIVWLEESYTGGSDTETSYDKLFIKQLIEFDAGTECTEDDCKGCQYKQYCYYQKAPTPYFKKDTKKKATFIPSDEQQEVIFFRNGICRVIASAGSGKTECVTERAARMVEEENDISKILFITFTDAGAKEMKARIIRKCLERGINVTDNQIRAMTFNTFAFGIVKANYRVCGFSKEPVVIDEVRNAAIISELLDERVIDSLDYLNFTMSMPNLHGALDCANKVFSIIKSKMYDTHDSQIYVKIREKLGEDGYSRFISDQALVELVDLYKLYDNRLKEECLVQFSDQEPFMYRVLEKYPDYLEKLGYEHIIVDEFQDSNDIQMDIVLRLSKCKSFKSLMVVGDPRQSIFGFRDTSPDNLNMFYERMGLSGKDIVLRTNRRSTPEIVELANKVELLNYSNPYNKEKMKKLQPISLKKSGMAPEVRSFVNKNDEISFISDSIGKLISNGTAPEDIAFIASKRSELIAMASELSAKGIPWVMKNPMKLCENSRVIAATSLAEAFYQPDAEILYFNYLIARYDGFTEEHLSSESLKKEISNLRGVFEGIDEELLEVQRQIFHAYLEEIAGEDEVYKYFLELVYQNEELPSEIQYISNFKKYGENVGKKMEETYACVVLTTAHSSKGLEWDHVFLSLSEFDSKQLHGIDEYDERLNEKRRLLFVAITRAKSDLTITGKTTAYGSKDDAVKNQFLEQMFGLIHAE